MLAQRSRSRVRCGWPRHVRGELAHSSNPHDAELGYKSSSADERHLRTLFGRFPEAFETRVNKRPKASCHHTKPQSFDACCRKFN